MRPEAVCFDCVCIYTDNNVAKFPMCILVNGTKGLPKGQEIRRPVGGGAEDET